MNRLYTINYIINLYIIFSLLQYYTTILYRKNTNISECEGEGEG